MLKNPNENCQLGSNFLFHPFGIHFIEEAHCLNKHQGW
jgi:hypothetical protein